MLVVEHLAFHLFREDAYREYCWSVDAYGCYQPASFIYLCFEAFRDLCSTAGLWLVPPGSSPSPGIFPHRHEREPRPATEDRHATILRIVDESSVATAKMALAMGQNVLALAPNEELSLFYRGDAERLAKARKAMGDLAGEAGVGLVNGELSSGAEIRWEEVAQSQPGRLLVTSDSFVSDGYFLDKYGKTPANEATLRGLVASLGQFKHPVLRLSVPGGATQWPNQEPFQFAATLVNHGPAVERLRLDFDLDEALEPAGSLERYLPRLDEGAMLPLVIRAIPKREGIIRNPLSLRARVIGGKQPSPCRTAVQEHSLLVIPPVGLVAGGGAYEDSPDFSRLLKLFDDTELREDVAVLPALARVDIPSCLNKFRVVAEGLLLRVLQARQIPYQGDTLNGYIDAVVASSLVSRRVAGYLHVIRCLGNLGSHYSRERLTDSDLRALSYALACIAEEVFDRRLL